MTYQDMIPYLKEGAVIRFWVKQHTGYDAASDTDSYEVVHYQGAIVKDLRMNGELKLIYVMRQAAEDLLPYVEMIGLGQITHVLVEVS